jgi:hypothetical protein
MRLGIKSMTGSRKLLEIMNRFGHAISYHTVEALETELATNISDRHCATPDGILQVAGICTGLAWDNYDEMNETLSGSGTLHDTVGICYQNKDDHATPTTTGVAIPHADITPPQDSNHSTGHPHIQDAISNTVGNNENSPTQSQNKKSSKRVFHLTEKTLEPYRKKPKITVFRYEVCHMPRPFHLTNVEYRDMLWMMCVASGQTPMWPGWNSLITKDPLPSQRIAYMDNLNLPPTRLDVVAETLRISQRVARECGAGEVW